MLDLRRPIYRQTAAYGHFGRTDIKLPWEALDKVEDLQEVSLNNMWGLRAFQVVRRRIVYIIFLKKKLERI